MPQEFQEGVPWVRNPGVTDWQQMNQDPGEAMEAQTMEQLAAVNLSQTEQSYLRQLQYGQSSVQRQMENGQIRPQQGMAMLQQMGQRAQPLRVRASQIPILMRRLQFQQMYRQAAEQERIMQENAVFRARRLQDRMQTVGGVTFMETRPGQFEPLAVGLQEGRGTSSREAIFTPTQMSSEIDRIRRNFVEEHNRQPNEDEVQARLIRHMDTIRGAFSHSGPPAAQRGTPPTAGAAASSGGAAGATTPAAPPTAVIPDVQMLRQFRDEISRGPDRTRVSATGVTSPAPAGGTFNSALVRQVDEAIDIVTAWRGREMPPDRVERLEELGRTIRARHDRLAGRREPAAPIAPAAITPPAARPRPATMFTPGSQVDPIQFIGT